MPQDPRLRRLESDYRSLVELKSRTDIIKFEIGQSVPPNKYRVTFECKGIMLNPATGQPCITVNHEVEIYLHSGYPSKQPQLKWITPIYHPNINGRNGRVCIQYWIPSMTIADLVIMLGNMVRYANYNISSPLDSQAAKWAEKNKDRFPIDSRELCTSEVKITFDEAIPENNAQDKSQEIEIKLV